MNPSVSLSLVAVKFVLWYMIQRQLRYLAEKSEMKRYGCKKKL